MSPRPTSGGTLVLDSEGLSKASSHRSVLAHLEQAWRRRARVVVSAAVLPEVLRGHPRDAATHRILAKITVVPVTDELGRAAGRLIGASGLGRGHAVDAMVVATALASERPTLILTSDPDDLTALVDATPGVAIAVV